MASKAKLRARIAELRIALKIYDDAEAAKVYERLPFVGMKYVDVPPGTTRVAIPVMVYPGDPGYDDSPTKETDQ